MPKFKNYQMQDYILQEYQKTKAVFEKIIENKDLQRKIGQIAEICYIAIEKGGKIMFCGNGGSAADSQHLAAELVVKLSYKRPALSAMSLSTDTSVLTATGNDYGYDYVFARQIEALGQSNDVLIGISTSGKSKNIVQAMQAAKIKKITTVGLVGENSGDIGEIANYLISMPSTETSKIQEAHIATGHIICAVIEDRFFGKSHKPKL